MNKIEVLTIFENSLGKYRQTGDDNYAFFCPFCNHYKRKLEINLETFNYHCWTCNPKFGGKNFYFLFRLLPNISQSNLEKIKDYTNTPIYKKKNSIDTYLRLPDEFKSLETASPCLEYKHAIQYLKKRGITNLDIKKYKLGFCDGGEYANRIIIPSYNSDGELSFFTGRTFFEGPRAYKNPKISKNIVFFENLVSWNHPIILCEGPFDAMAIKRNAIPLLGKLMSQDLLYKIKLNSVSDIYVCLDSDAKKDAMLIAEQLIKDDADRNVYLVELHGKDPSEIGFSEIKNAIKKARKLDFKGLVYSKLFE